MSKTLWRVTWNLEGPNGPPTSFEFPTEDKAIDWSEALVEHGAGNVVATELIVGRTLHFSSDKTLFT